MNRMTTTVFGLALIVLLCGVASAAETIYVPGDYATIQSAVDNATAGDTIYVYNGSYTENVNIGTPHLTLEGEGADVVTVTAAAANDNVFIVTAERVNISGFTMAGATRSSGAGIYLDNADHCNISGNNASENRYGIHLWYSSSNTLQGNTMSGNTYNLGVFAYALSDYIQNIDTSNMVDGKPIYYWVGQQDREIPDDAGFVGVVNSTNITVKDLVLTVNRHGVIFAYTDDSRIENVTTSGNDHGIYLTRSSNNMLSGSNTSDNQCGICIEYSSNNNTLVNNIVNSNKLDGICLRFSSGNTLHGNTMFGNRYNFGVDGYDHSAYPQYIDTSNTVDGRPIYYWVGQQDRVIPDDAGFVGVVDSTNITVRDLVLTKNFQGVLFAHTDDSRIENVTTLDNNRGIYLCQSTNDTLCGNNASRNNCGIYFVCSSNNTVRENTASGNGYAGIYLWGSPSDNNEITCNLVCNNKRRGLYLLFGCTNNTISHNNIIENGDYNETSGGWEWQFYNDQPDDVDVSDNWWGTGDEASIAAGIYGWNCDSGNGNVTYLSWLDAPAPCVPGTEEAPGEFTTADALIALEIAAGSRPNDPRWDVSGDGVITSLDALMILQVAVGGIELGS